MSDSASERFDPPDMSELCFCTFLRELDNNNRKFFIGRIPKRDAAGKPTPLFTDAKHLAIFIFHELIYEDQKTGEVMFRPYCQ